MRGMISKSVQDHLLKDIHCRVNKYLSSVELDEIYELICERLYEYYIDVDDMEEVPEEILELFFNRWDEEYQVKAVRKDE